MTQDYYDCNYNLGEVMAPAYKTSNGALYGYETGCVKQDEESPEPFVNGFEWYFPSTNHNVNYLTVYCETSTQG